MRIRMILSKLGLAAAVALSLGAASAQEAPGAGQCLPQDACALGIKDDLSRALGGVESAIAAAAPKEDAAKEARAEKRDIEDLQAQKDMVYWAEMMFWATITSMIVGFITLLSVFITLFYAAKTNQHTEKMLRITEEIAIDQNRPYLSISIDKEELPDWQRPRPSGCYYRISFYISNSGQTPAYNIDLFALNEEDRSPFIRPNLLKFIDILCQGNRKRIHIFLMSELVLDKEYKREKDYMLEIVGYYSDIYRIRRFFCHKYRILHSECEIEYIGYYDEISKAYHKIRDNQGN